MWSIKLRYCPNCAGMDIGKNISGLSQCKRCNFVGDMKEGSIDEINSARKRFVIKPGAEPVQKSFMPTNKELRERLEKLKEKKSADFEFL